MSDERQQFDEPTKASPAGPVTNRAVFRKRRYGFAKRRIYRERPPGVRIGAEGLSAADPRAWPEHNPQPTTDNPQPGVMFGGETHE